MTLVLGGTGKTGSRVAERLVRGNHAVRIGTRAGGIPFDWTDRATWQPALRGVSTVYVAYVPDLAVPGAPDDIATFTELAVRSGVRRVVLLSGRGEPAAQDCEEIVRSSGVEWTIVRASWFAQNFSEGYLLAPVLSGEVALPAGDVPEPFVDIDDLADVAVAALTEGGHAGQLYEVTGPRALTFAEAVAEIARASGRPVGYRQVSAEEYAEELARAGLPAEVLWFLDYLFTTVLDGRNALVADGVQRALGREPRDFTGFAERASAAGAWSKHPAGA